MRTRERVRALLEEGHSQAAVARLLGLCKSTIAYHARTMRQADARFARRYDWAAIRAFYEEGHSINECRARFGVGRTAWPEAVARGPIVPRPVAMPIDELLRGRRGRDHIKRRLLNAGLLEPRCQNCGIDTWLGGRLSLELHHING